MRQVIRFNADCISRVRAAQTKPAPALRTSESPEKPPPGGWQSKSLAVFRTRHHKFGKERMQIRSVQAGVTLREEGSVHHSTTAWLPVLPDAIKPDMVLEILADAGQMLHDRDTHARQLRVLQEQEFERLGSGRTHRINVRMITATHRHLTDMVAQNGFRSDLYYRLNVFPIDLPPLRERSDDIPQLICHFVKDFAKRGIDLCMLDLVANKLGTTVIEIESDKQLEKLQIEYVGRGESIFATLDQEFADDDTYGITFKLQNPSPWEQPYVSIIDSRGRKRQRRTTRSGTNSDTC